MSDEIPPLSFEDAKVIIGKLGDLNDSIVLIGGQAVGFWVAFYGVQVDRPLTSKDIDFCGKQEAVELCAELLDGEARLSDMDRATPVLGVVFYVDGQQYERKIDFLGNAFGKGLDYHNIHELAITVDLDEARTFRVMHPVHTMESRVHNVAGLGDLYDNDHGREQLRKSVVCVKEFLRAILDAKLPDGVRQVMKLNKRIFRFAAYDDHALAVYHQHGLDVFEALLVDQRLPEKFRQVGYGFWVDRLKKERD